MPVRTSVSQATARSLVRGSRALASAITTWTGDDPDGSGPRTAPVDDLIRTTAQFAMTVASRRRERHESKEMVRDVAAVVTAVALLLHHRWARRPAPVAERADRPGGGC